MKFCKRTAHYALFDHKEMKKLEPVAEKLRRYKSNWLGHVTRMNKRMPKIILNYRYRYRYYR